MKNINIVYRRPKIHRGERNQKQQVDQRRYVDEYMKSIARKNSQRIEISEKQRSQTAVIPKKIRDSNKHFTSLKIMTLKNPTPPPSPEKQFRKTVQFKTQKIKKIEKQFVLNLPKHIMQISDSSTTTHTLRPKDLIRHSQAKSSTKIKCTKETILVISADFIINEFSFWGQEGIEPITLKYWKTLMPLVSIVWVTRKQSTVKKIQEFAQAWKLRVDGIVQIQPTKRQCLTVSFHAFEQQARLVGNQKIMYINSLTNKSEEKNQKGQQNSPRYFQFRNKLPIISQNHSIHLIRIDMSDRNRFSAVMKIISQQQPPPCPFDISPIFKQFEDSKIRQIRKEEIDDNISEYTHKVLQELKMKLYREFEHNIGLNAKVQGNSMAYIIGDSIKRNFQIAKQFYKYCQQTERKNEKRPEKILTSSLFTSTQSADYIRKSKKLNFPQPIYIWNV